jgi:hypothetical protein
MNDLPELCSEIRIPEPLAHFTGNIGGRKGREEIGRKGIP